MQDNLQVTMDEFLPLRDVVFNTLRQAILTGELKPGERLMEIHLANKLGCKLEAVVAGSKLDGIEKQVMPFGVDVLHVFDAPGLYPYTSLPHTSVMVNLFKEEKPQICLMGATVIGRDLGPRVSSALTSGLTADCTALETGSYTHLRAHET